MSPMMRNASIQQEPSESASGSARVFAYLPPNGIERRYRDRRARVYTPEEIRADERDCALAGNVTDEDGRIVPEFERAARGDAFPLRNFRWRCVRALRHGASLESLLAYVDDFRQFLIDASRKFGTRGRRAA